MKRIKLTQGKCALVDDEDFERVSQFKWVADKDKNNLWYASRHFPLGNGKRTTQKMHTFILNGLKKVDHKNSDGLDNQKHNLRPATTSQNGANRRKQARKTSSVFKGVWWVASRKKWRAGIKVMGKQHFLGQFICEKQAALAYNAAAKNFFGEFAKLNPV